MNLSKIVTSIGNVENVPDMAYVQKPDGKGILLYRSKRNVYIINPIQINQGKIHVIRFYYAESHEDATRTLLVWISEMAKQMNYSKYFRGTSIFLNQMARRGIEKINIDDLDQFLHAARMTIEGERTNPEYIYRPRTKKKKRKPRKKPLIFQPISLE